MDVLCLKLLSIDDRRFTVQIGKGKLMEARNRFNLFGIWIDPLTMEDTLKIVDTTIQNRVITQHVAINVAKMVRMQKDENLRKIVNSCGLISADGQGIVWAARYLGLKVPERVAGIDLMLNVIKLSSKKKYKIFLLGAKEDVLKRVVTVFTEGYPGLKIVGYKNGYFSQLEEKKIVSDIRASEAEVLFVAMSSPSKEIFLNKYINDMNVPFVMGVGGSFDVVAGKTRRAPFWLQKIGLEWFFRFLCEPKRMWKRYLITNISFLLMLLRLLVYRKVTKE